ncbi:hypothetical protein SD70_02635 [Gordoniibacillus kamchatkensis]|uniref:Uncharacterized protein n=1 Tax=Gordoniibacillus kamchatkensis TaxID=1590651 RepID=A0ABR5AMD5_9BACL|nr:hypothetical protein [Paenibacillus sp. VKM B-2647]KIL42097.1 hypothetical protein SD70_02635 [Paenibacillus sp. VKM B-2647]
MTWEAMSEQERDAWIVKAMGWSEWPPIFPTSDISAAMEAEEKIMQDAETRGYYFLNLADILDVDVDVSPSIDDMLSLIHASAADRCKAMFLTIQHKERKKYESNIHH